MTKLLQKSVLDPQLLDSFLALKNDVFRSMNCVKIGQIQSFDGSKKTAQVQILFKRVVPDKDGVNGISIQDYPVLVDCPVFTLQGGGGAVQLPITAGDQCIILFSDRNIDAWFKTGSAQAPFDARCHDLSDGIALVGINALTSGLEDYSSSEMRMIFGGAKVGIQGGLVTVQNDTTSLLILIQGLIDIISAATLDVNNSTLSSGTIAALNTYKLAFNQLLY